MREKYIFYIDSMQKGGANRVMANLTEYFSSIGKEVILINDIGKIDGVPEYSINPLIVRKVLNVKLKSSIISNLTRIIHLRKIIQEENADVVVSFMGPPNIRMLFATIGLKCKKIVSVRNDPNVEYGNDKFIKTIVRKLFNLADGCVFQTEEASMYFSKTLRDKSRVIFNPVHYSFYSTERSKFTKNIVTVGRLEKQKNHELLIKAFSKIAGEIPEEKLIIYGEGTQRNELEHLVYSLHLQNRVLLPGNVDDVPEKLSQAKLFVMSSNFEGMPNALMEAMAVGVPVISTNCPCGGPRSILKDGKIGILVNVDDSYALSKAMLMLMSNNDLLQKYGDFAKKRANDFEPTVIYSQWNEYISGI